MNPNESKLQLAILDAIKLITENTNSQVSYDVRHTIEMNLFKKSGKSQITIAITLSTLI